MTALLDHGWARGVSLFSALVLMLLVTLLPRALTVADGSPIGHGELMLIMWGLSAGFVHGVGFVPKNAALRFLLGPLAAWPLMLLGFSHFARHFL
ncbi:MAG: cyd operon YbgE family protein [Pseudomonadota bacterium]